MKVRFAPSPTGYLHVGNVRTALVNWLFARKNGGQFLLRIDDTDRERSRAEYEAGIEQDLHWLGLNWDEKTRQSDRMERYAAAIEKLKAAGRLYACYETPEELDIQRKQLAARGLPPVYNRAGLKLTDAEKAAYEAQGRKAHWRFLLNDAESRWEDLVRGPSAMRATTMSDPVLVREGTEPVYNLASVVDDGELGITHLIRGEDHVSNTAVQMQLFEALGYRQPIFAHLALLKTKDGELSKRVGGNDIRQLRDSGVFPMSITSLLAKLGTSDAVQAFESMEALIHSFDLSKFGRAPANYDAGELLKLNEKLIHSAPFAAVQHRVQGLDEATWLAIRSSLKTLDEAAQWVELIHTPPQAQLPEDDRAFVHSTIPHLPPEPWGEATYDTWIAAVKPTTERKGKALFMPIRLALTGMEHGPELKVLLPLLGRERVLERLG